MRMTERVREIIDGNLVESYIPLVVQAEQTSIFPMYNAHIIGETSLAFPVTEATGIHTILSQPRRALVMVVDRQSGYEAYVLEGAARHITNEQDYDLVAEMRALAADFPIESVVLFDIQNVHLAPPP